MISALSGKTAVSFTHSAAYLSANPPRRPEIEIEIAAVSVGGVLLGSPVRTNILVDSGADTTMLDASWASALGIDLSSCRPHYVGGIGGSVVAYRYEHLVANICGTWVKMPSDFVPGQKPQLLGREGVFDAVAIGFFHSRGLVLGAV